MRIPSLPLTREHGSWAVMAVPLIVGTAAADRILWEHAVLAAAALAAFLAYVPAQIMIGLSHGRRVDPALAASAAWWLRVLPAVALAALAWLLLSGEFAVLVWGSAALVAFAVHAWITRHGGVSLRGNLAASTGLSAGAPAALMLGGAATWGQAALLWLLVAAFFGCSVVYVHMKIRAVADRLVTPTWQDRIAYGGVTVAYHVAVIALVSVMVVAGGTHRLALAAFIPMAVHAVIGTIRLADRVRFRRLGFLLLGHSLLFAFLMSAAWRDPS